MRRFFQSRNCGDLQLSSSIEPSAKAEKKPRSNVPCGKRSELTIEVGESVYPSWRIYVAAHAFGRFGSQS